LQNLIGWRTTIEKDLKQFLVCYNCYLVYDFVSRVYVRGKGLWPVQSEESQTQKFLKKIVNEQDRRQRVLSLQKQMDQIRQDDEDEE